MMNWLKLTYTSLCLFIAAALLIPPIPALAQSTEIVDFPLEAFHEQKPVELHGLISTQTLNIPIPQSWSPGEDNWIEIRMRMSPLLDLDRSSITISINNRVLISDRLAGISENEYQIAVPASALVKGNNTLNFTGALYLPEDPKTNCQNWHDPARWLVVEPGGTFHLSFVREDTSIDLASFPEGFTDPLEMYIQKESRKQTLFVMPENPTSDDLSSISAISYVLGSYAGASDDWHPEFASETDFNDRAANDRNVIFIGRAPEALQNGIEQSRDFLGVFPSPWGVGKAAMIIGDHDRQDGFTPAAVFSDPTRGVLLQGNVAYLEQKPLPAPSPFRNDFTFEELGYLDRTVRGIGQQNLIYRLYIPYDVEPVQVKLHLGLAHTPDLDLNNSTFTIYLNGFSIAGLLPSPQNAAAEPITIGFPARRLRPGVNYIRLSFDLRAGHSSCDQNPDSLWVTILNTSSFEVSFRKHSPTPSLKYFPLPFSDSPGSLFVIPDQFQANDLTHISELSHLMGSLAGEDRDPPEAMIASAFLAQKAEVQHKNIILVGLPSQNSATLAANGLLPQPFRADGHSLQEGYGVQLPTADKDASLGLLQILPSPWVNGGTVLVLTGTDPQGLEWTWNAVLNSTLRDQFHGNLMVVGSDNRSQTLGEPVASTLQTIFQGLVDVSNIPIVGSLVQKYGADFLASSGIAIGSALLLTVFALWLLRVSRNRNFRTLVRKEAERKEHE